MKKNLLIIVLFFINFVPILACEVCKANQPKILRDITHGAGPQGTMDYIITWSAAIIVGITLILSIKLLVFPKEHDEQHIKFLPLNDNQEINYGK